MTHGEHSILIFIISLVVLQYITSMVILYKIEELEKRIKK